MKRLIAIMILTIGLIPSIPLDFASARTPSQVDLQRHCRSRLGFGQTEPVYGSLLHQLRRCIDNTRNQYELAARLLHRKGIAHYSNVSAHNIPQMRETQRSLNRRVERQEKTRISYYRNVPLRDREFLLQDHRRSRRLIVHHRQQILLLQKRAKLQRWRQSIQTCKYYVREERHDCVQFQLTVP